MGKRINIMLPETTLAILDRVAAKGDRSSFISRAVLDYVRTRGKRRLQDQLMRGYRATADESLTIAAEWFPLEEEASKKTRVGGGGER